MRSFWQARETLIGILVSPENNQVIGKTQHLARQVAKINFPLKN